MNQKLSYSLSSNCLINSQLLQSKKYNQNLQFANRFRKIHLYNAIHSVSKQKLNHSSKYNQQQISPKNVFLSKNKKKQQFIQGIMQQKDKSQNKFIKLKHFNAQKRPQTFNQLPLDGRTIKINTDKNFSKNQLAIKAQKLTKNKEQRLSLRLSTTASKQSKNQLCQNEFEKKKIKKWETACIEEFLFDDLRFRRSIESSSLKERDEKYKLIKLPSQVRKTEMLERKDLNKQRQLFSIKNRISLHDHINESHQRKQSVTNHKNFIQNAKQRYSVTAFKTNPNLFAESDINKDPFELKTESFKRFDQKVQHKQKLINFKQEDKQNNHSLSDNKKNKLKPGYIQKFLKASQLKNQSNKQNTIQTENSLRTQPREHHSENFSHLNAIQLLHPDGQFSTYFEDQFNPW